MKLRRYDELDNAFYGEDFFLRLENYVEDGLLAVSDAINLTKALVNADEIRERYAGLIQHAVESCIETGRGVRPVLSALEECCALCGEEDSAHALILATLESLCVSQNAE